MPECSPRREKPGEQGLAKDLGLAKAVEPRWLSRASARHLLWNISMPKNSRALAVQASDDPKSAATLQDESRETAMVPQTGSQPEGANHGVSRESSRGNQLVRPGKRVEIRKPDSEGWLKEFCGSTSSVSNETLLQRAFLAMPSHVGADHSGPQQLGEALLGALRGIRPRDELEGALAVQMFVLNFTVLDFLRVANSNDQRVDIRCEMFSHAVKGSRACAALLDALNRHRGKGRHNMTIKHIHLNKGARAIVGPVNGETGRIVDATE